MPVKRNKKWYYPASRHGHDIFLTPAEWKKIESRSLKIRKQGKKALR